MWKHIFDEFWGKLQKFQDLNINKSYFANLMELEGLSTKDLDTNTYFMS